MITPNASSSAGVAGHAESQCVRDKFKTFVMFGGVTLPDRRYPDMVLRHSEICPDVRSRVAGFRRTKAAGITSNRHQLSDVAPRWGYNVAGNMPPPEAYRPNQESVSIWYQLQHPSTSDPVHDPASF